MSTQLKPRINAAYYDFIPRPNDEDKRKLKKSIIKNGVQIPIVVNRDGFILDGHTRYEICLELGITDIPTETKVFASEDAERKFVVMTNLARRHLNKFQKVELSWPLFELEKKRAKERADWKKLSPEIAKINKKGQVVSVARKIKEGLSAEIFGKKIGIGKTLINHVDYIKKNASPELLKKCRDNEISIHMAYDLIRGQKLMSDGKKPEETIQFCPMCKSKTQSPKKTKCHVHKWFCCELCRWGI